MWSQTEVTRAFGLLKVKFHIGTTTTIGSSADLYTTLESVLRKVLDFWSDTAQPSLYPAP